MAMRSLLLIFPVLFMATAQAQTPSFKYSGSPMAPITLEVYTDYQCPHCREFYLEILPPLTNDFIKAGKVRLIHRDFPLSQFPFSRTAMHYANAAGQIGKYDAVALQLFETQPDWSQNGNVDAAVAKVLTPSELSRVRTIVKTDTHLDDSVERDIAMASGYGSPQGHAHHRHRVQRQARNHRWRRIVSGAQVVPERQAF